MLKLFKSWTNFSYFHQIWKLILFKTVIQTLSHSKIIHHNSIHSKKFIKTATTKIMLCSKVAFNWFLTSFLDIRWEEISFTAMFFNEYRAFSIFKKVRSDCYCRSFRSSVTFAKYLLEIRQIWFSPLIVWLFSVKMLLLVFALSLKDNFMVFRFRLISVTILTLDS